LHKEVLPALTTLSFADANKVEIAKNGGLPPLVALLKNPEKQIQRQAAAAIANLAVRHVHEFMWGIFVMLYDSRRAFA
jgi:hypothetical protein